MLKRGIAQSARPVKTPRGKGTGTNCPLWAPIRVAADWLHQAAHLLSEDLLLTSLERQQQLRYLLQTMQQQKATAGSLEAGIEHFLKVSDSYWAGLFHTYEIEALPRTNNDLEGSFGQLRHHQRRVSGRKAAPASLVLRGSVRLIAAIVTRMKTFNAKEFATVSCAQWREVRAELKAHQLKRDQQRRFRRDPESYLSELETRFLQLALPH